jgi:ATP-dependent Zn protease
VFLKCLIISLSGASSDFQKANAIADNMVKKSGMSEKAGFRIVDDKKTYGGANIEYSGATMELVDNEIKRLLQVRFFFYHLWSIL